MLEQKSENCIYINKYTNIEIDRQTDGELQENTSV